MRRSVRLGLPLVLLAGLVLVLPPTASPFDNLYTVSTLSDATIEATSPSGASYSYGDPTVSYTNPPGPSSSPDFTMSCSPASGSTFSLGTTAVTCTATGQHLDSGYSGSSSFNVTVRDSTPPTVTAPSDITTPATGQSGAAVSYSASASDLVDGSSDTVTCAPTSGSTFNLGTTGVSCSATDAHSNTGSASFNVTVSVASLAVPGNQTAEATGSSGAVVSYATPGGASCSPASGSTFPLGNTSVTCDVGSPVWETGTFTVTVQDTTKPSLTVPSNTTADATGPNGAAVTWSTSSTDTVDSSPEVTCSPNSGSTFPLGTTTVNCFAQDASGNSTGASFTVTVVTPAAVFSNVPASRTVEATGASGATVDFTPPTATDPVNGARPASCSPAPGSTFALGATTVTCSAGGASATFTVTVKDTTPPKITPVGGVTVSAKPGAKSAIARYQLPQATDVVDGTVHVTCAPPSGSLFPIGATVVLCQAKDAAGNSSGVSLRVRVKGIATKSGLAPAVGTRLSGPPLLNWPAVARAAYYNVQVWLTTKSGPRKVFSIWPKTNRLQLPKVWTFERHRYRLAKGVYRWYVWPGFGPLALARYGGLIGSSTFLIVR